MTSSETRTERVPYQLPARLKTEDKLILLGPLSLTLRQGFLLTLGGCLAVDIWRTGKAFAAWGAFGPVARVLVAGIPAGISLIWAFVCIADRYLEDWGIVLLRYRMLLRRYRWQSICQFLPFSPPRVPACLPENTSWGLPGISIRESEEQ